MNIHTINAKEHEFTSDELGDLLLASVQQIKQGEFGKISQIEKQPHDGLFRQVRAHEGFSSVWNDKKKVYD